MSKIIKNIKLRPGMMVDIEHTSVDERHHISAQVACCHIQGGRGVAVFHNEGGEVYLWSPDATNPHGNVKRVDGKEDILINPYVRAFSREAWSMRPVDSKTGCYSVSVEE